jgi:hypothetical protein
MKVYYHDNLDTDQRLPHEGEPVSTTELEALGVFACNIPDQSEVDRIAKEKGYRNRDEVHPFHRQTQKKCPSAGLKFMDYANCRSRCHQRSKEKSILQ